MHTEKRNIENKVLENVEQERILSLHSFRFLFALMIFFHHFVINDQQLFDAGGSCAVTFFMILGGFMLTLGYGDKVVTPQFRFKPYIAKRLWRIYPVHLLTLLVFIAIFHKYTIDNLSALLPNLLLLQSWIPDIAYYFSFNSVSWYLSDTILFYLLFPTIIRCIHRLKRSGSLALFAIIIIAYFIAQSFVPDDRVNDFIYISPLFRLVDFIIGVALCFLYKELRQRYSHGIEQCGYSVKSIIECAVIILMVVTIIYFKDIEERYATDAYFWPATILLILTFALFGKSGGAISSLLSRKIPRYLGSISLEFYIAHLVTFLVLSYILEVFLHINPAPYPKMALYLLASLAVSYLIKRCFNPLVAKSPCCPK
jgi:peptidoglycan/LPS O-acetylase OafA/YrhL